MAVARARHAQRQLEIERPPSMFHDCAPVEPLACDVPWLLSALRSCEVLSNLSRQFVLNFLDTLAHAIESELWLHCSARVGVDVLVKLAKSIAVRDSENHRVIRMFSGLLIETGTRGELLSVPPLVRRESGEQYERRLTYRLRLKKSEGGRQPVLMLVDHPSYLPGIARAVHNVFHDEICQQRDCISVRDMLNDDSHACGTIFALDLNHRFRYEYDMYKYM